MLRPLILPLFIFLSTQFQGLVGEISDLRKCADPKCEVLISTGFTTQRYTSRDKDVLSFAIDEDVKVFSKEEGKNLNLWGVEIGGRRGYVPKRFIKEAGVKTRDLRFVVPTGPLEGTAGNTGCHGNHCEGTQSEKDPNQAPTEMGEGKAEAKEATSPLQSGADPLAMMGGEGVEMLAIQTLSSPQAPGVVEKAPQTGHVNAVGEVPERKDIPPSTVLPPVEGGTTPEPASYPVTGQPTGKEEPHSESQTMGPEDPGFASGDRQTEDEEGDNEAEGNGNEGEENGSEVTPESISPSGDGPAPDPDTASAPQSDKDGPRDPGESQSATSFEGKRTPLHPTPSQTYEVVDGTTIYPGDPEAEQFPPHRVPGLEGSKPPSVSYPHGGPTPPPLIREQGKAPPFLPKQLPSQPLVPSGPPDPLPSGEVHHQPSGPPEGGTSSAAEEGGAGMEGQQSKAPQQAVPAESDSEAEYATPKPESVLEANPKDPEEVSPVKEDAEEDSGGETATGGLFSSIFSSSDSEVETKGPEEESAAAAETPTKEPGAFQTPQESAPLSPSTESAQQKNEVSLEGEHSEVSTHQKERSEVPADGEKSSEVVFTYPKESEVLTGVGQGEEASVYQKERSEVPAEQSEISTPQTESEVSLDDVISNLPFVDPDDQTPRRAAEDEKSAKEDKEERTSSLQQKEVFPEHSSDLLQHQEDGDAASGTSDSVNASYHQDSLVGTITDHLRDVSAPLFHWVSKMIKLEDGLSISLEAELADPRLSAGTMTFLLVVAGTIVVLYLSHLLVVKASRESPLLEMMNKLDRDQRILCEENNNLKQQLTASNGQIKSISCVDSSELHEARHQFELQKAQLQEELAETRERNQQLETDLELLTANQDELHRMLNELLSDQRERSNFEESVNSLQKMLDDQREVVESLTSDLALKTRLNDELRGELKASKTKTAKLEYQIEQLTHSMEEVNTTKQEYLKKLTEEEGALMSLKEMNDSLRQEMDRVLKESKAHCEESARLREETKALKRSLSNKDAECQISKECLKKLQVLSDAGGNDVHEKLAEIFKIIETKARLATSEKECDSLRAELQETKEELTDVRERVSTLEQESWRSAKAAENLQKERDDAVARLGVLTQYYEEKETQLKKELESQGGLLQNAKGSAAAISNRMQAYELELASCRSQMESLKAELEEQKQFHRIQLTKEEKKVHDSWLAARAAERRQEELRQENSQLRQKLTQMQKENEQSLLIKPQAKRVDANGSVSSPIPLDGELDALDLEGLPVPHLPMMPMFAGRPPLPPPPPGMPPGLPPPPMPPHMFGHLPPPLPDRRLPPAGRIASPPGYDRRSYSPGSDHSHYSDQRYSPGPRYSPGGNHRGHSSPPGRKSDHLRRNSRREQRSPSPSDHHRRHSPDRWYTHSPQGFAKHHRSPPPPQGDYYDGLGEHTTRSLAKGKKTSTPLGPNDR